MPACTVVQMPTCLYGYSNAFLPVYLVKDLPACAVVRGAEVRGQEL